MRTLEADGLQSDSRFMDGFVRSQFARGRGSLWVRQALRLQGLAGEGLEAALGEYDWDAALERVHGKKFGAAAPATPQEYAARVRFLSQRGFEPDRIQALLRRLRRGDD